jgi:hypothetical protein
VGGGVVLKGIRDAIQGAKVALDFIKYNRIKRKEHREIAKKRFSTAEIECELTGLIGTLQRQVEVEFDYPVLKMNSEIKSINARISVYERQSVLLQRSYDVEIGNLYGKLSKLKVEIDDTFVEKSEARSQMQDAQASIDHWYRMSNCYVGNRGREIPKSALFGRSQNDLDYYKSNKESAYKLLSECGRAIADLRDERDSLKVELSKVKSDKNEMIALKKSGININENTKNIRIENQHSARILQSINEINNSKSLFLLSERSRLGIVARESLIEKMNIVRVIYIKSFDTKAEKLRRKQNHRQEWFAEKLKSN